ncbi:CHAD domain-containing protein [Streptomyces hyderabadensis]|uniref:CHAD domain-containing protein n=1 Tax=Streptomyces hyderabadensis TaxID=598549 RepID=A0ABP9I085_9ACTN|nr:CHAD domain-containing protein [Streptomyces hyderabadensis]
MAQRHLDPTDPTATAPPPHPASGHATARGEAGASPRADADTDALVGYLRAQATEFLRALRRHRESGTGTGTGPETGTRPGPGTGPATRPGPGTGTGTRPGPGPRTATEPAANGTHGTHGSPVRATPPADDVDAARALRRAARRISATLHTFQPLLDADWAEEMRPELAWLSGTLAMEHAYASRLERLLQALHRLSGSTAFPAPRPVGRAGVTATVPPPGVSAVSAAATAPVAAHPASANRGNLTVGAAKAGALLDRQLTLARTRAHSTALQALGSSRFHAVADKVALLASEVPLSSTGRRAAAAAPGSTGPDAAPVDLRPLAAAAQERLTDAVAALPLVTAGSPYNAEALVHGLSPDPAPHPQDAPWHQVRLLLRLHRYALEALAGAAPAGPGDTDDSVDVRLLAAGEALDRHRDAAEAAAAAAQAARTPRIAPATAYALGVLHADQRHEVEAARYAFQHCWRKEPIRLP